MAKAGDRYEVTTGNIWAYAHRGDMTGVKAALARGVDINLANTVGWTAAHAAAAGGHCKILELLIHKRADVVEVRDRGGNLPIHEACKGGHASAAKVLVRAGSSLESVRLSHTKGAEVRALVMDAMRAANRDEEAPAPVGYARKQVKSNAFFGPRRTPISGRLKKQLLQDKRQRKRCEGVTIETQPGVRGSQGMLDPDLTPVSRLPEESFRATVQAVKRERKASVDSHQSTLSITQSSLAQEPDRDEGTEEEDAEDVDSDGAGTACARGGMFAVLAQDDADEDGSDSESGQDEEGGVIGRTGMPEGVQGGEEEEEQWESAGPCIGVAVTVAEDLHLCLAGLQA